MNRRVTSRLAVIVLSCMLAASCHAQTLAQASRASTTALYTSESFDVRTLRAVYAWDSAAATVTFGGVDATAYPVIALSLPSLWTATAFGRVSYDDARSLSVGIIGAFATTMALKRIVGRERPFAALADIAPKSQYTGARGLSESASFPSGHATLAGAIAVAAIHLHPSPGVVAASAVWAGGVAMSRVWLGVHYLSDVLVGLAVGAGATSAATLIWP